MNALRNHRLSRRISVMLAMIMVLSLFPAGIFADNEQYTVLVFPFIVDAENAPRDLESRMTTALCLALSDMPGFNTMQFLPSSPSVRRAISEGRIRQVDVEEGAEDLGNALVIGSALKVDYIVIAEIASYTKREDPTSVEMVVSGQMFDVAASVNPDTGEPVGDGKVARAFGVSGNSIPRAHYTGRDSVLIDEAVRDAARKAALALAGKAGEIPAHTAEVRSPKSWKWVVLALVVGGLAVAVSSSGGSKAPTTTPDSLPPQNLRLEEQDGSVAVTWEEPTGTVLTVLRYEIMRAVDGGSFSRIDQGTLGPGSTFFNDFNTLAGRHTYQYRVRTLYTNGTSSPYVHSGAIIVTR